MTLVQNHQQLLSGNKKVINRSNLLIALTVALGVASCAPKATVLRSPVYQGQAGGSISSPVTTDGKTATSGSKSGSNSKNAANSKSISLLLPFQLNKVNEVEIQDNDITRSALALDFYQGFQQGLADLQTSNQDFNLDVIDSRDNVAHVGALATSEQVSTAKLIVGPVYPQEIRSFGTSFVDKDVLQINPLAATPASEFNLPNLVSITPSIKSHTVAIGEKVARDYYSGDVVIIYNTADADSKLFLTGMLSKIKASKPNVNIISVSTIAQLNEKLSLSGTNFVISGTTNKASLNGLVTNLLKKSNESYYSVRLYGHPLWDRFDFSLYPTFNTLSTIISTESNLKNWTSAVKNFKQKYYDKYGVYPSDQSYKGYDVATYFGGLINKYGVNDFKSKLTTESYQGIYNTYKFSFNENWGYTNESVSFKEFRSGSFQLL